MEVLKPEVAKKKKSKKANEPSMEVLDPEVLESEKKHKKSKKVIEPSNRLLRKRC